MSEFFAGKVALISGSSRGVGFAVARELVVKGAGVVISARGERRLGEAQRELEAMGGDVAVVPGDVGNWPDAQGMVNAALDHFGRLDILVNNAGVSMRGDFVDLAPEVCDQVVTTNLTGSIYLSRAAIAPLIDAGGHIVFISSIAGLIGVPGASVYCATKTALTGLSESLRIELDGAGVHVGVAYLGFTEHDPEKRVISADGSLVAPDRPAHQTQAFVASRIVDMIEKRKRQLIMSPIGKVGQLAHRVSPRLTERAILWARSTKLGTYQRFS